MSRGGIFHSPRPIVIETIKLRRGNSLAHTHTIYVTAAKGPVGVHRQHNCRARATVTGGGRFVGTAIKTEKSGSYGSSRSGGCCHPVASRCSSKKEEALAVQGRDSA